MARKVAVAAAAAAFIAQNLQEAQAEEYSVGRVSMGWCSHFGLRSTYAYFTFGTASRQLLLRISPLTVCTNIFYPAHFLPGILWF